MIGEEVTATVPLIEAVYARYGVVERTECDDVSDALRFMQSGEDYGELSSIGVWVDGDPHLWRPTVGARMRPPFESEERDLRARYAGARER